MAASKTNDQSGAPSRFLSWSPALLAAQLALVVTTLAAASNAGGWAGGNASSLVAGALVQGLLGLLRALPLLFLLSWPCLALRRPRQRFIAIGGLWSLFVLVQAALDQYFRIAGTPLGADLFGYSVEEIRTTIGGGSGIGAAALLGLAVPLAALWSALWWCNRRARTAPTRVAMVLLLASIGAWWLPLSPAWPPLHGDAARALAVNKLAWFGADTWRWVRRSATEVDVSPLATADAADAADAVPFDPQHPFLHPELTPDTLGPFFRTDPAGTPPNLVVIVVEGLGRSFSGPQASLGSFTPFLDELATRSLYFDNFLANQGRTFGVLPSLLGSAPFAEQGFTALGERMPAHPGLFNVLAQQGYHTAFYTGTDSRFDNERAYMQLQGTKAVVDLESFGPGYTRNPFSNWGYADGELVSRVLADNANLPAPFAMVVQTISMHTAYRFPGQDAYRARFEQRLRELAVPEGKLAAYRTGADVYSTILYTDDQLRRYFESVANTPWYANTVFVVTGDHRLVELPMDEHIDRYHVPLIIHSPLLRRPARIGAVSSHLDVAPSLLALLANGYGLERPASTPWLGEGLDMAEGFRNQHEIPLKQTKTSEPEFLVDRWWLRDGQLFELSDGMRTEPVDNPRLLAWVQQRLHRYVAGNAAMLQRGELMPDGGRVALVAYDGARARARPVPTPPRVMPGIALESVQLARAGEAVEASGVFVNGDDTPSALFVPLAVLSSGDGRDLAEAYGEALRLKAHERRAVRLALRQPGLAPGRYFISMRPSDPDTGKAIGRGRFHIPYNLAADGGNGATP